jgi:DNA-binding YbaB/EbfC family protein
VKGFGNIVKQAQQMQARLQKLQEEAGGVTAEATAGGGVVTAVANGRGDLVSLRIDPAAVDPADVGMLEDLVTAAVNEALRKARETMAAEMQKVTGGMGIPGLL